METASAGVVSARSAKVNWRFRIKVPSLELLVEVQDPRQRVYIVSYPNSGRTWLRVMLSRYKQRLIGFDEFHVRLHAYYSSVPQSPQYIFYHARSEACPAPTLWDRVRGRGESKALPFDLSVCDGSRAIFLLRDPRDVVVSNYHEMATRQGRFKGSLSAFVRDSRVGIDHIIGFSNFVYEQSQRSPLTCLLVQYEEMHRNPEQTLRRVCEFSQSVVVDDHIRESVRFASLENMQKLEAAGALIRPLDDRAFVDARFRKVRRGVVGGHRDELDEQDIAFIDEKVRIALPPFFHEPHVSWLSRHE